MDVQQERSPSIRDRRLTVTVQNGARLSGTGTIGSTQINSGRHLGPWSGWRARTALAVSGSLAFTSGAIYLIAINPTSASTTNVSGTAALAGTVQANFAAARYASKRYTILTAAVAPVVRFCRISNVNLPSGAATR